jgi:Fur family transcriptional regulator, ferric uptake regulator
VAADESRRERVLAQLRHGGGRVTIARRAVLDALLDHREHVTADELAAAVQAHHPDVHLSTVYRALDAFEKLGVGTHVHLGHGRAIYHLTDEIHHHAVCEACGAVVELAADVFDDLQRRLEREHGFRADAHHFALVGHCGACAGEPQRAPNVTIVKVP